MKVKCAKCDGSGQMDLSETMEETLLALDSRGWTAGELLYRFSGVSSTAINNRLEDLRALNLVRRERRSKEWVYFPLGPRKVLYSDIARRDRMVKRANPVKEKSKKGKVT